MPEAAISVGDDPGGLTLGEIVDLEKRVERGEPLTDSEQNQLDQFKTAARTIFAGDGLQLAASKVFAGDGLQAVARHVLGRDGDSPAKGFFDRIAWGKRRGNPGLFACRARFARSAVGGRRRPRAAPTRRSRSGGARARAGPSSDPSDLSDGSGDRVAGLGPASRRLLCPGGVWCGWLPVGGLPAGGGMVGAL